MFCFYIQFNGYAFYNEAFYCLAFAAAFFLFLFITFIEIPALSWNPSFHYTPSLEKPRTLYNPLFSMSWYYDLPHLWTMFYPLHDRSTFTEQEMSLVDRKYLTLNQLLNPENNSQNDLPNLNEPNLNQNSQGINRDENNFSIINGGQRVRNRNENQFLDMNEQLLNGNNNN